MEDYDLKSKLAVIPITLCDLKLLGMKTFTAKLDCTILQVLEIAPVDKNVVAICLVDLEKAQILQFGIIPMFSKFEAVRDFEIIGGFVFEDNYYAFAIFENEIAAEKLALTV